MDKIAPIPDCRDGLVERRCTDQFVDRIHPVSAIGCFDRAGKVRIIRIENRVKTAFTNRIGLCRTSYRRYHTCAKRLCPCSDERSKTAGRCVHQHRCPQLNDVNTLDKRPG